MKLFILLFLTFFTFTSILAQKTKSDQPKLTGDQFLNVVEQSLDLYYADYAKKSGGNYDSIIAAFNYENNQVVEASDELICQRLAEMNKMTPFHLECNEATLSTIKFFISKRRGFARVVLGRSRIYFDMYEAKLTEHGLPIELKYLSVIESGLRPQVKSRAGALGLWQFMYGTGKMFGLKENSYMDERMDPELATDAACRYLKQLYGIYNDWNLALAAYNAGPGNVNKAIRRSGNKTTYWEVRPFLPRETQGYVPNFIAATYLLTYHAEHNIVPAVAPIHFAELDTMCLKAPMHMSTITKLIGWDENEIKELNPVYKLSFIPETTPGQCITGPRSQIGKLISQEDSLYKLEYQLYHSPNNPNANIASTVVDDDDDDDEPVNITQNNTPNTNSTAAVSYHKVRSGETLGVIASKYGMSVSKLMSLNGLRSTNIYVGQRLKVESDGSSNTPETNAPEKPAPKPAAETKKYYSVRSGDSFGKIAQRHGQSISQLRKLNPGVNVDRISVGQRIRVK